MTIMEPLSSFISIILHLDIYLNQIVLEYKNTTYAILFFTIFLETGIVAVPFLPGDSLLFAAGTISALGTLNPLWLIALLSTAAILGDTVNYWIGRHAGSNCILWRCGLLRRSILTKRGISTISTVEKQ